MLHRRAFQGWQAEGYPNLRAEGGAESAHRTAEGGISRGDSSWPQRVRSQGLSLLRCEGGVWGVKIKVIGNALRSLLLFLIYLI